MTVEGPDQDVIDAASIHDKGWRQGSVLDPRSAGFVIPRDFAIEQNELLIVCTQSCSVVSPRFKADPFVELMIIQPRTKYNGRAPEATGKNSRKLLLQLPPQSGAVAIECDFNRRFFCDRKLLLRVDPLANMNVGDDGAEKLAGWMARAYTRIALPNQLVERLKELLGILSNCLETPYGDTAEPVAAQVPFIYLKWEPRTDQAEVYTIEFIFICNELGAVEVLDEALIENLQPYADQQVRQGILLQDYECKLAGETFLTDLDGYNRFSDWDYLSDLGDIAQAPAPAQR